MNNLQYIIFFSFFTKITYSIFKFLFAPLVPRRFKSRISDRVNRNMKNTLEDLLNYKTGTIIILFNQLFMGLCSAYLTGVAVIIFSIMFKISNSFLIAQNSLAFDDKFWGFVVNSFYIFLNTILTF